MNQLVRVNLDSVPFGVRRKGDDLIYLVFGRSAALDLQAILSHAGPRDVHRVELRHVLVDEADLLAAVPSAEVL